MKLVWRSIVMLVLALPAGILARRLRASTSMPARTAFDSLAVILIALVSGAVSAAPVSAQARDWSANYGREHAAVSTNGVEGTWTIDWFSAMWSHAGEGGWLAAVEHQRRYGLDDVALLTRGYRQVGDWTFGADAAVAPDADFLCRTAAGGEVSYRAVGTIVVSGGYHFKRFPSADIQQFEPVVTWYREHGELQTRWFVTRDTSPARTSTTFLLRAIYDFGPRLRFAAGGSIGDRIFNIDPSFRGTANGWLGFTESRLGLTDRDFVVAGITAAHEQPAFEYVSLTLGYKRVF
jgi:YaiO family outer membrane protein